MHPEKSFSSDELLQISREVDQYFAPPFEKTTLTLMEVDPFNVHAYWNITEEDMREARARLADDGQLVLRMYDVTLLDFDGTNARHWFDIHVHGLGNNWYIELYESGKSYLADIGLVDGEGRFASMKRSNTVHIPRRGQSLQYNRKAVWIFDDGDVIMLPDINKADSRDVCRPKPGPATPREDVNAQLARYYGIPMDGSLETTGGGKQKEESVESSGNEKCRDIEIEVQQKHDARSASSPEPESNPPDFLWGFGDEEVRSHYRQLVESAVLPPEQG